MQKNQFIAPGAHVIGEVHLGKNVSIWYNTVVRGDTNTITIGDNTNVQDNTTIHTDADFPVQIGRAGTGCNCILGAGSLVTGKTQIPDNTLAFGNPAKPIRIVTAEEKKANLENAMHYYTQWQKPE